MRHDSVCAHASWLTNRRIVCCIASLLLTCLPMRRLHGVCSRVVVLQRQRVAVHEAEHRSPTATTVRLTRASLPQQLQQWLVSTLSSTNPVKIRYRERKKIMSYKTWSNKKHIRASCIDALCYNSCIILFTIRVAWIEYVHPYIIRQLTCRSDHVRLL